MDTTARLEHLEARKRYNEEFVKRLVARRPDVRARVQARERELAESLPGLTAAPGLEAAIQEEATGQPAFFRDVLLETIVREERPVLFLQNDWINKTEVTIRGIEAQELVDALDRQRDTFMSLMPLIGRIDVTNFPGHEFVGTGWFVARDVVVTNRHVASLIARWDGRKYAFSRGIAGNLLRSSLSTAHEFDDLAPDKARVFAVKEVLYIEPDSGPHDIAFLRVERRTDGTKRDHIEIADADVDAEAQVFVVGYPARAPRSVIPDQQLMRDLYRGRYDVKRAAPGYTMSPERGSTRHDCTTLGGNSGPVVLDLTSGKAVGLHFSGLYQQSNYAVRATVLTDYVTRKRWDHPPVIETAPAVPALQPASPAAAVDRTITITIPSFSITVNTGAAAVAVDSGAPTPGARVSLAAAEAAAKDFWDQRPDGVIAVRVGFGDDGDTIGDVPFIAASVPADRLAAVQAAGPARFQTLEVRYLPAEAAEQIETWPSLESVDSIAYDDDARTGEDFSFDPVDDEMTVTAHVGPEYSWDVLKGFLGEAAGSLVSAMYEFHGAHIADAIEQRLADRVSLHLVLDNATFTNVKNAGQEFERAERFEAWKRRFDDKFQRIVAPEGVAGLISDSYHIKVTVREDDTFWLSSGNWKEGSSQPVVTQQQRDDAADVDLPGNREWHVVIRNKTLAGRFRSHILQDFRRSEDLGGSELPPRREAVDDVFVDVPIEEGVILERRPPGRVLEPREFRGRLKVKPLLTPDQEGAVYSEAVLKLIRGARKSLLFQIPYISMPSNPRADRGFIDELIKALTQKLKTLEDARLILRSGGSKFSSPTHAAWYLKSKGVDVRSRVRQMENHHTKGMIVDGKRVLLGSHNWSKPGVTLNRDASLIFESSDIAAYYAEAFEIDWERANPVRPKRFVRPEGVVLEAAGAAPPSGYQRVRLSDLLKDDD